MSVCKGCSEEIIDGDLRYNGREPEESWHAHCWSDRPGYREHTNMKDLRAQFATNMDNFNHAFEKLKKALGEK